MDEAIAQKIDSFFKRYKHQTYKKGELLIRADEDPLGIFYITGGIVKEYAISKRGDEVIVNMFKPVSFFPISWAMNNTPNSYYFEAVEQAEVWRAPKEEVLSFLKDNPDVMYNLLSRVYRGLDGMMGRMTKLMSESAHERLIGELIILAKRFGEQTNQGLTVNFSEKEIASQTGMTRETVSREIQKLKEKKLVLFEKNLLIIPDISLLESESDA